jgi:hypothetical protein
VALASAGAVATASSIYNAGYPVSSINNNERTGANWGAGGGWADGTTGSFPDWVQIAFNGSKTIDRVVVYTLQDNYTSPVEPSDSLTFAVYGNTHFSVEGWNGASWTVLSTISNNNLVKRTVSFAPFTTDRIRINITAARSVWSMLTEVEAWGVAASGTPSTDPVAELGLAGGGGQQCHVHGNGEWAPTRVAPWASPAMAMRSAVAALSPSPVVATARSRVAAPTAWRLGEHSIVATYSGDGNHAGSYSAALTQVIDPRRGLRRTSRLRALGRWRRRRVVTARAIR